MTCSNCGSEMPDGALFCDHCGHKAEIHAQINQKRFCSNCGAEIERNAVFCGNCGWSVETKVQTKKNHIFCGNCGAEIENDMKFCGECGAAIGAADDEITSTPTKRKSVLSTIIILVVTIIILLDIVGVAYIFYFSDHTEENVVHNNTSGSEQSDKNQIPDKKYNNTSNSISTAAPTAQAQSQAPIFTYATASGMRGTDTEGGQYSTDAVLNSDKATKWAPATESNGGVSEWIQINASELQCVNGIMILNGYHKSDEIWRNNNRVKDCTLSFSDGQSKTVKLDDTMDLIKIDLDKPINTTYIRLTINSLYKGKKWNDTAITYLSAY